MRLVTLESWQEENLSSNQLTIVEIPTRVHHAAGGWLSMAIAQGLTRMGVNIRRELLPLGTATFDHKEADQSYFPSQKRSGKTGDWPTITLETGWSESHKKLREDAEKWLTDSNGDVKAVITVKVSRTRITIVQHKLGTAPQRIVVQRPPKNRQAQPIKVTHGPLIISFEDLLLREPGPGQTDLTFERDDLIEWASKIWGHA